MTATLHTPTTDELVELLFTSRLQASAHPSVADVREAIDAAYAACAGDSVQPLSCLAAEAGDHPEECVARIRWCRLMVARLKAAELAEVSDALTRSSW